MGPAALILDDDEDLREALAELITRDAHCHMLSLGSFAELEREETNVLSTQIALLDISLGANQPNGVAVYRWLKNHHYLGRILFITGHATSAPAVQEALSLGKVDVLAKPVNIAQLLSHVREALGQQAHERPI